jgi:hypothetical protein
MRTSLSTLLAGALALGVITTANATELATLSDAQLDTVAAGGLYLVTYDGSSYPGILTGQEVRFFESLGYTVTHLNPNNPNK